MKRLELTIYAMIIAAVNFSLLSGTVNESLILLLDLIMQGQWLRLLAHPFVHVSWYHLLLDGVAFFVLYAQLAETSSIKRTAYVLGCGLFSMIAVIISLPYVQAAGYCGLSGIDHGLMAICSLEMISQGKKDKMLKIAGIGCMAVLVAKCLIEAVTGTMVFDFMHSDMIGSPVALSHLGGLIGALMTYYSLKILSIAATKRLDPCVNIN